MCRLIESLMPVLELDSDEFWGPESARVVDHLLDEAKSETARTVAAKTAAAQKRFATMLDTLDLASKKVLLAVLSGRAISTSDYQEAQQCPVCDQQGWLNCTVERGPVEYDGDDSRDMQPWVSLTAYPFSFQCPVCGLELEADELAEFDFATDIELDADSEPFEVYDYEPYEDYFRDR
jgi:rubredoxin